MEYLIGSRNPVDRRCDIMSRLSIFLVSIVGALSLVGCKSFHLKGDADVTIEKDGTHEQEHPVKPAGE